MQKSFDLIVIGAGSGGLAAAKRAASYGASVAIVEADRVGGTCVIRGCVPKKLLVYGSLYRDYIKDASSYGVDIIDYSINPGILLSNIRKEVDRLNTIHSALLDKAGIETIFGRASFISQNSVTVRSSIDNSYIGEFKASKILIAVGGAPFRLDIPGSDLAWVSDNVFEQNELPEKIVIVGAGYIACEFACIFNSLGVDVVQLVRGNSLLRGFDIDLAISLEEQMRGNQIDIRFNEKIAEIIKNQDGFDVVNEKNEKLNCSRVLMATGRRPMLDGLDLENAGVNSEKGFLEVDECYSTNVKHIFAIGDVTNRANLTPVAIAEGRALSDYLFAGIKPEINYNIIPSAVFSQPELASVGLREDLAIDRYGSENIKVYKSIFRPMSHSLPKGTSKCLMKLVLERNSEKILGCHMVGDCAAEIIQMASISISMGASKKDFDKTMALHPTISEEFVTMR